MFTTLTLIALCGLQSDGLALKFIASGATARTGGYRPLRAQMDGTGEGVRKLPDELTGVAKLCKYGTIQLDGKSWLFVLHEPEGQPARLFVDTNGDGDLSNDPATKWSARTANDLTMYQGSAQIDLGDGQLGSLGLYRFDPKDPARAALQNTLMFYTDFGYEVTLQLDDKSFTTFVSGRLAPGSTLAIDRDGNGQISYKREIVVVDRPFNFTGTTYVLTVRDGQGRLETATESLPLEPLPPDLQIGRQAIPFDAVALDGKQIDFPKRYAGKIVMLDFWATWCGPCIAELPNLKQAYAAWHDQGFEVLGISFDNQGMAEKLKSFIQEQDMPWPQLYEGKGWQTELGALYDVSAIPFVLLVDGDSGEILGTSRELRGPGLSDFIGKALAKKKGSGQ